MVSPAQFNKTFQFGQIYYNLPLTHPKWSLIGPIKGRP
ncbi:hypothetical protein Patl1_18414 [Pistacia atlantica]|uniref:Uncharacterized protein n=1 Tax=Pistacia atlantica TaxID=434234 RepID=A0ACC1BZ86_9ROSI|nr:hypothetical protein Patl1_18414 [Pistacia atlantica]